MHEVTRDLARRAAEEICAQVLIGLGPRTAEPIIARTIAEAVERETAELRAQVERLATELGTLRGTINCVEWQGGPEKTVAGFREEIEKLRAELAAARAFKAWVHSWLDRNGVPADPDPQHTATTGCRISGRMEWWQRQLAAAREELAVRSGADPGELLDKLYRRAARELSKAGMLHHGDHIRNVTADIICETMGELIDAIFYEKIKELTAAREEIARLKSAPSGLCSAHQGPEYPADCEQCWPGKSLPVRYAEPQDLKPRKWDAPEDET